MQLPPVLFEDEALVAFDKPSGLLVCPDRWQREAPNLIQAVHEQMSPAIFNAHRLDRGTSGVLLCTKTPEALKRICADFAARRVTKRYVVLVQGAAPSDAFTVDLGIAPDPNRPGRMLAVREGGKPAVTVFRVIEKWRGYVLVEAVPQSGRTHQIRVHLASAGCPVVADVAYGDPQGLLLSQLKRGYKHKNEPERPLIGRVALHAESLTFPHPVTGEEVTIHAPYPSDFRLAIKYLTRFAGAGSNAYSGRPHRK